MKRAWLPATGAAMAGGIVSAVATSWTALAIETLLPALMLAGALMLLALFVPFARAGIRGRSSAPRQADGLPAGTAAEPPAPVSFPMPRVTADDATVDRPPPYASGTPTPWLSGRLPFARDPASPDEPAAAGRGSAEAFLRSAAMLLQLQLVRAKVTQQEAFVRVSENMRAAGVVYGGLLAVYQYYELDEPAEAKHRLLERAYQATFGDAPGAGMLLAALHSQEDLEFVLGRLDGAAGTCRFIETGELPTTLTVVLDPEAPVDPGPSEALPAAGGAAPVEAHVQGYDAYERIAMKIGASIIEQSGHSGVSQAARNLWTSQVWLTVRPFSYGIVVLKQAFGDPAYLDSDRHRSLRDLVVEHLVDAHVMAARAIPVAFDFDDVHKEARFREGAEQAIDEAASAVCEGIRQDDMIEAVTLLQADFLRGAGFLDTLANGEHLVQRVFRIADEYLQSPS